MGIKDCYDPTKTGGAHLQPGVYKMRVIDFKITETKSTGKEMLVVTCAPFGQDKPELKKYLVEGEYFSQGLNALFDACGLSHDFENYTKLVGKTPNAMLGYQKEAGSDGKFYCEIKYFTTEPVGTLPQASNSVHKNNVDRYEGETVNGKAPDEKDEIPF